jgi:hypothetical protein
VAARTVGPPCPARRFAEIMTSRKSVYRIVLSPDPTPAVLFETSNLSHRPFKYVEIILVCGRRLLGQVGSGLLGAAFGCPTRIL